MRNQALYSQSQVPGISPWAGYVLQVLVTCLTPLELPFYSREWGAAEISLDSV